NIFLRTLRITAKIRHLCPMRPTHHKEFPCQMQLLLPPAAHQPESATACSPAPTPPTFPRWSLKISSKPPVSIQHLLTMSSGAVSPSPASRPWTLAAPQPCRLVSQKLLPA